MFYSEISKDTLDQIMTLFFKNLGMIDKDIELEILNLEFDDDVVTIEANPKLLDKEAVH